MAFFRDGLYSETCPHIDNQGSLSKKMYVNAVQEVLARSEESAWLDIIVEEQLVTGSGRNKLRTYRLMKRTYETEQYCLSRLQGRHRSAFAKFRCGLTPVRVEMGRYEG